MTASGLQILWTEFETEDGSGLKHSDDWSLGSIRKRAVGHCPSPSSSDKFAFVDGPKPVRINALQNSHSVSRSYEGFVAFDSTEWELNMMTFEPRSCGLMLRSSVWTR